MSRKLTRKQEEAIVALLTARSVEEAAKTCNTSARTLYRWLNEAAFGAAYRTAKRKAFGQATTRLQQAAGPAAGTLMKVMVDPATPAATRVRAAESILSHGAKAIEIEDIEARLEELERSTDETKPGWRNH